MNLCIISDSVFRFINRIVPRLFRHEIFPALRSKFTIHPRCHIQSNHRCFNWYRSTSAEWINQHTIGVPRRKQNHRCRQCLRNRCRCRKFAVTAFVKRLSGRIQPNRHNIFHNTNPKWVRRPGLFKPIRVVGLFEFFNHCLFHNFLNVRRTEQFTAHRVCLRHPELSVFRYVIRPRNCFYRLKQIIKTRRTEAVNFQQNSFRCTQKNVGTGDCRRISEKCHFAIIHLRSFITKILYFTFQHRLHSKMTRRNQFILFHSNLIFSFLRILRRYWTPIFLFSPVLSPPADYDFHGRSKK